MCGAGCRGGSSSERDKLPWQSSSISGVSKQWGKCIRKVALGHTNYFQVNSGTCWIHREQLDHRAVTADVPRRRGSWGQEPFSCSLDTVGGPHQWPWAWIGEGPVLCAISFQAGWLFFFIWSNIGIISQLFYLHFLAIHKSSSMGLYVLKGRACVYLQTFSLMLTNFPVQSHLTTIWDFNSSWPLMQLLLS